MTNLSSFPILGRWPARHPDRLQLYSWPTPNGVKVSIMLEEIGLPYEAHRDRDRQERNLDAGIPVAEPERQDPRDPRSGWPGWSAARTFRIRRDPSLSGGENRQAPAHGRRSRYETIQWVFFQMAAVGPMFGQLGYFNKFAGREIEDKRPLESIVAETKRLLGVLDTRLAGRSGSWARIIPSRTCRCSAGCAT